MGKSKFICDTNVVNFDMIFLDCVRVFVVWFVDCLRSLFKVLLKGPQGFNIL